MSVYARSVNRGREASSPDTQTRPSGRLPRNSHRIASKAHRTASVGQTPTRTSEGHRSDPGANITKTIKIHQPERPTIVGVSVAAALRWMGAHDWTARDARAVLDLLDIELSENTLVSQVSSGRSGWTRETGGFQGDVPLLTRAQEAVLKRWRRQATKRAA